ncbi:MAG TPA: hypothetical protein VJ808_01995 [Gemmatimonadales bacterium]|nr:hypothetical protein [Gemmatimonadales bacterium]
MNHLTRRTLLPLPTLVCVALGLQACGVSTSTVNVATIPEPVEITMTPAMALPGGSVQLKVSSPSSDSISVESIDGLDRYWDNTSTLTTRIGSDFGDSVPVTRYAVREHGRLFDVLKKPMKIVVCRKGSCRNYYHDFAIRLPERNERSIAVTGGWSTAFTKRALTARDKSVLLKEALSHTVWNVQAEIATGKLSGRVQAFYGADERGGSLDLSHEIKQVGEGMSYGLAMRLAATHAEWLPTERYAALTQGTAYRASIGPSIMIKGLTASSQLGIYTDGQETLQEVSTFVSLNGGLTEVRTPVTVTLEKTFAFGGEPLIPRRRDQLERLTLGFNLVQDFSLRFGMTTHRSAWPTQDRTSDLKASEVYYMIGGQYTLSW